MFPYSPPLTSSLFFTPAACFVPVCLISLRAAARSLCLHDLTKAQRGTGGAANLSPGQACALSSAVHVLTGFADLPEAMRWANETKRMENLILSTKVEEGRRRKFRHGLQVELTINPKLGAGSVDENVFVPATENLVLSR